MESFVIETVDTNVVDTTADPLEVLLQTCIGTPGRSAMDVLQTTAHSWPSGCIRTDLTGTYWLTFETEAQAAAFRKHVDSDLCVLPASNPMMPSMPKPLRLVYAIESRPKTVGVPRFYGLSKFGPPTTDHRTSLNIEGPTFCGTLRELQVRCNAQASKSLNDWGGAVLLADCGFGKTATSIELAVSRQTKTLILCNREILMHQWIDSIRQFTDKDVQIGYIQGSKFEKGPAGTWRPTDPEFSQCYFVVGSIESFAECGYPKSLLSEFGLVMIDEMHHIAAASLVHVLPLFASKNIVGLTATPNRADGLERVLYWMSGPCAFVYQRRPEITGIFGSVQVFQCRFDQGAQREIMYRNGTLGFAQMMTLLTEDTTRNDYLEVLIRHALQNRSKVIVVTSHVAHAKGLFDRQICKDQAIMAGPHQMPVEAKQTLTTRLVYATYSLLEEGYDDPRLDALILATPRSRIQQVVGRVERSYPGKAVPWVLDVIDTFSLYPAMSHKRASFYQSRGFAISNYVR